MRSYNGFSSQVRERAFQWCCEQVESGARLLRPCDACAESKAEPHSESYEEPFGDHIGAFSLCRKCHFAVHTRHQSRYTKNWETKKAAARMIRGGRTVLDDIEESLRVPSVESLRLTRHSVLRGSHVR